MPYLRVKWAWPACWTANTHRYQTDGDLIQTTSEQHLLPPQSGVVFEAFGTYETVDLT